MTVPMRRNRVCKARSTGFVFPPTSILCLSNKPDRPQLGVSAKTFATFDSTVTNARQVERDRSRARHSASGVSPREGAIDSLDRAWSYHFGRAFLSATQLASCALVTLRQLLPIPAATSVYLKGVWSTRRRLSTPSIPCASTRRRVFAALACLTSVPLPTVRPPQTLLP